METDSEGKMAMIKERINRGDYRVDPQAVADAILRRIELNWDWAERELDNPYTTCSYPESSAPASTKESPLAPEVTDPMTVRSVQASKSSPPPQTHNS